VVTGAGSGIGRAFALELAARGGEVVCSDIDLVAAQATVRDIDLNGGKALAARCDVSSLDAVFALADTAQRWFGVPTLVVNNAGVGIGGTSIGEAPIEDWEWTLRINLWGPIHGCHVFAPILRAQKRGHILNVASAAGLIAMPAMAPYNLTKAAVVALSETMFADLAGDGVGVSVLCPSFFPTNLTRSPRTSTDPKLHRSAMRLVEKGGWTAKDVAQAALAGVAAGKLHIAPQFDVGVAWRLKRLAPGAFQRISRLAAKFMIR
jgi:NAD(P)-dependent dehydrogenase (short-subunit alcohol dehydrogenase family)